MKDKKNKLLVFGVGNEILTDDGIGPKLVKRLKNDIQSEEIEFDTAFLGGLEILEHIQGYKSVIFIDAIKTLDGVPGDVYRFSLSDFKETLHLSNLHDISFLTAIELGKRINYDIPEDISIVAVEIVEDTVFSDNFTPAIDKRYDEIYNYVKEYISEILSENLKNIPL